MEGLKVIIAVQLAGETQLAETDRREILECGTRKEIALVAQLKERPASNREVASLSLAEGATAHSSEAERALDKRQMEVQFFLGGPGRNGVGGLHIHLMTRRCPLDSDFRHTLL